MDPSSLIFLAIKRFHIYVIAQICAMNKKDDITYLYLQYFNRIYFKK